MTGGFVVFILIQNLLHILVTVEQEVFCMENMSTGTYNIYKDISARTNGDIYIGVVGPVRTGKSTFIDRKSVV